MKGRDKRGQRGYYAQNLLKDYKLAFPSTHETQTYSQGLQQYVQIALAALTISIV